MHSRFDLCHKKKFILKHTGVTLESSSVVGFLYLWTTVLGYVFLWPSILYLVAGICFVCVVCRRFLNE